MVVGSKKLYLNLSLACESIKYYPLFTNENCRGIYSNRE